MGALEIKSNLANLKPPGSQMCPLSTEKAEMVLPYVRRPETRDSYLQLAEHWKMWPSHQRLVLHHHQPALWYEEQVQNDNVSVALDRLGFVFASSGTQAGVPRVSAVS